MATDGGRGAIGRLVVRVLVALRARRPRRPVAPELAGPRRPVTLVIHDVHGVGGTIRSTVTQANWFVGAGHPTRIVSVAGSHDVPFFDLDPAIELVPLDDPTRNAPLRRLARGLLRRLPSQLFHPQETRRGRMSVWRDLLLIRALRRERDRVVIGTRAGLDVAIALFAPRSAVAVGQEHVPFEDYPDELRSELATVYPHLDALMVLTRADAVTARQLTAGRVAVEVVPNAVPDGDPPPADPDIEVVVAAGRFSRNKRHDLLLRAFAEVAPSHPTWRLRLFGRGPREARVRRQVAELGIEDRVELAGVTSDLPGELARASVFALTSDLEAFGIVLVEAMQAGLAVVSTACPHGPPELLTDEVDGLLVTPGDAGDIAAGLDRVMSDRQLRQRLGAAARATGERYTATGVSGRWLAVQEAAIARRGYRAASN